MSVEFCATCGWAVVLHHLGECPMPGLGICKMCRKSPRTHVGADFCEQCTLRQTDIVPGFYMQVTEKRPRIWVDPDDLRALLASERHPFDCGVEGCEYRLKYGHVHGEGVIYGSFDR